VYLRFCETETRLTEHNGSQFIEGCASRYNSTYFVNSEGFHERIDSGAFTESLASGQPVESRYNHDANHVLARTDLGSLQVWTDEDGLKYRVRFDEQDPDHCKIRAKLNSGLIRGSSVAMLPTDVQFREEDGKDVCIIRQAVLRECGPVNTPANLATDVSVRCADDTPTLRQRYQNWKATQRLLEIAESLAI